MAKAKAAGVIFFLLLAGCTLSCDFRSTSRTFDSGAQDDWDGRCFGRPGDEGRQIYWDGYGTGPVWTPNRHTVKYTCKKHDNNRWWFEATP